MKRMLGLLVLVGVAALAACPPPDEKNDAGTPDAATTCDRPYGIHEFSEGCYYEDDCVCGLGCLKPEGADFGICLQRCGSSSECTSNTSY